MNNLNLTRGPNSEKKKKKTSLETKTGCDVLSLELFSQPLICMSAFGAREDKSTQKYTHTHTHTHRVASHLLFHTAVLRQKSIERHAGHVIKPLNARTMHILYLVMETRCVCLFVCAWESERESEREGKRWTERGMKLCHYASIKQKTQWCHSDVCLCEYVRGRAHGRMCVCAWVCVCVILGSVLTVRTLKRNLRHYFLRGRKRRYTGKERKGCRRDEWALSGEQGQCDVETGVSIGEKYSHACVCAQMAGTNHCIWCVVFVHIFFYVWLHDVTPQLCWIIAILLLRGTVCSCNCSARVVMFSDDSVRSYSGEGR